MIQRTYLLVSLLLMLVTGCAINDIGFTNLRYFENETSYLTKQKTWGGFVSTQSSNCGLTLGHAERMVIPPLLTEVKSRGYRPN